MFCNKCGKEVKNDAKICPYCGQLLKAKIKRKKSKVPITIIAVAGALIIASAAGGAVFYFHNNGQGNMEEQGKNIASSKEHANAENGEASDENAQNPTPTLIPLDAATETVTPTPTLIPLDAATETVTPTPTLIPLDASTETAAPTPTLIPLDASTETAAPTPTLIPLDAAPETPTPTPTPTQTPTPTLTSTPTPTPTPKPVKQPQITSGPTTNQTIGSDWEVHEETFHFDSNDDNWDYVFNPYGY